MKLTRTTCGAAITVFWLIAIGVYCFLNRTDVMTLKPNELGDMLAGAFGPVAFLWLVLGYMQQGLELRQSTQALTLQAEELRRSVEQQTDQSETFEQQLLVAKSQFDHEVGINRANEEALLKSRQPFFSVYCSDPSTPRGLATSTRYSVTLKNFGAPCTIIRVLAKNALLEVDSHPFQRMGNEKEHFLFSISHAIHANPPDSLIRIYYLDAAHARRQVDLSFTKVVKKDQLVYTVLAENQLLKFSENWAE